MKIVKEWTKMKAVRAAAQSMTTTAALSNANIALKLTWATQHSILTKSKNILVVQEVKYVHHQQADVAEVVPAKM